MCHYVVNKCTNLEKLFMLNFLIRRKILFARMKRFVLLCGAV